MSINPDLQDYIDFFGCEPVEVDDAGWSYGVRFLVQDGGRAVVDDRARRVATRPGLDPAWRAAPDHRLRMVGGWQIERRGDAHHLLVRLNTGPAALCGFEYVLVRIRPSIEVECQMMWGPGWAPSDASAQPTTIPPFA